MTSFFMGEGVFVCVVIYIMAHCQPCRLHNILWELIGYSQMVIEEFAIYLCVFTKLWMANISFIMSLCLSVCMDQLGCHWADFHEIWYLRIFENLLSKNSSFIKIWQE
jgi:hypothetical protein